MFDGLDTKLMHHEIDHLESALFIDRVERIENLNRMVETDWQFDASAPVAMGRCGDEEEKP